MVEEYKDPWGLEDSGHRGDLEAKKDEMRK